MKILKVILGCLHLLLCGCSTVSSGDLHDLDVFKVVIVHRFSEGDEGPNLISRLSINGKDPSDEFIQKLNTEFAGFFAKYSNYKIAKGHGNFGEFNIGGVVWENGRAQVRVSEGAFPTSQRLFVCFLMKNEEGWEVEAINEL